MSAFDQIAWIRRSCPAHADRAIGIHDAVEAAGVTCGLGPELEGDDDVVVGISLTFWKDKQVLGCASLDDYGLSFWTDGVGGNDTATDAEMIAAAIAGGQAKGEKA